MDLQKLRRGVALPPASTTQRCCYHHPQLWLPLLTLTRQPS